MQVKTVQYAIGTLSDEELAKNRCDFGGEIRSRPLDGTYYRDRSPDWSKVRVPFLKGCGPFLHDDPVDRPPGVYAGKTAVHFGADHPAYVLLSVIPPKKV